MPAALMIFARQALVRHESKTARTLAKSRLKRNPRNAVAPMILSSAYVQEGQYGRARLNQYFKSVATTLFEFPGDRAALRAWRLFRAQFVYGQNSPDASRNSILHGANTSYGTPGNALRYLLLFDYVQRMLVDAYLIQDGQIHLPGCLRIASGTNSIKVIRNALFAFMMPQAREAKPCTICNPGPITFNARSRLIRPLKVESRLSTNKD